MKRLIKFDWIYSNSMIVFMCNQTIASMVNIQRSKIEQLTNNNSIAEDFNFQTKTYYY